MLEVQTGIYPLDFFIPEHNLCVEVDGSTHYYGLSQHPLAKTELKYRLMRLAGLKVLRIEHFNMQEMFEEPDSDFEPAIAIDPQVGEDVTERQLKLRETIKRLVNEAIVSGEKGIPA